MVILVASTFSFLPTVAAYSPSSTVQSHPNWSIGFNNGKGGHGGGGFTCPTISGADQSVCSTNWSGYVDTGSAGTVTYVSGSWTVPTLQCPSSGTTYVAIWVGIDGYTSTTVEQTGVLGECSSGTTTYSAWYEFYPAAMVTISGIKVSPNDGFTASVTANGGGSFSITITDTTTGSTNTTTGTVSGAQQSSAEWILERPALCRVAHCTLSTLANFGNPEPFTSASATVGGKTGAISAFSDVAVTMVGGSSGPILALPSPLSGGTSFTIAYQ
ncbi:MAG: hypothetical protein JRN52_14730 [Nitrososphaerota archaeon]|nr:hypothetical protein [Nitrososphaerota archaeon]